MSDSLTYDPQGIYVTSEEVAYAERVVTLGCGPGKHNTINLAKRCILENIPGDFVEAGVNMGGHPALMAWVIKNFSGSRKVHMYDSFQGVPEAGTEDPPEWREIMGVAKNPAKPVACGRIVNPLDAVKENMVKWSVSDIPIVYHVGWFEEVLPTEKITPEKIALLRIDVDLYHSTEVVLEHLYPRVSTGGYVISDDWGEGEGMAPCRKATLAYFDKRGLPHPKVTRIPSTPGTVWWKV